MFPVLKMDNGSGIRVMDFWNMEQVHCGTHSTSGLYRHDYIDYADVSCISFVRPNYLVIFSIPFLFIKPFCEKSLKVSCFLEFSNYM